MDVVSDDVASPDEQGGGLDLSPRPNPGTGTGRRRRAWPWIAALVVLVVGIGFVISRALTDATQFYLRTDEAVARQAELGTRPFRMEGTVTWSSSPSRPTGPQPPSTTAERPPSSSRTASPS
jgi:hypothetical protein